MFQIEKKCYIAVVPTSSSKFFSRGDMFWIVCSNSFGLFLGKLIEVIRRFANFGRYHETFLNLHFEYNGPHHLSGQKKFQVPKNEFFHSKNGCQVP